MFFKDKSGKMVLEAHAVIKCFIPEKLFDKLSPSDIDRINEEIKASIEKFSSGLGTEISALMDQYSLMYLGGVYRMCDICENYMLVPDGEEQKVNACVLCIARGRKKE